MIQYKHYPILHQTQSQKDIKIESIENKNEIKNKNSKIRNKKDHYDRSPNTNVFTPIINERNITSKSKSMTPRIKEDKFNLENSIKNEE